MGRNLGPLNIKDSYEGLVQISGSDQLTDGSGSLISSLDIAASTATSASHALNADNAISASYATTASFALNVTTPSLQEVTDVGNSSTNTLQVATGGQSSTLSGTGLSTNGGNFTVTGGTTTNGDLILRANDTNDVTLTLNGGTDTIIANTDITATNISASGYVSASAFIGDGSQLSGIDAGKFNDGAGFESLVGQMLSSGSNNSPQGFLFASGSSIASTGLASVILGGTDNDISGGGGYSTIIGGLNNEVTGNFGGGIFGGRDNTNSAYFSTIVGGNSNNLSNALYGGIFGGDDNSVTNNYSVVLGGQDNTVSQINGGILAGTNNTVSHARSAVIGGDTLSTSKDDEVVVPSLTATNISSSGYVSASAFIGDGSQLSGISATPFPFTGSAEITGSLELKGGPLIYTSTDGTLNSITDSNEGHFILGGYANVINNGQADIGHGIMASYGSTISSDQYLCAIVGTNAGSITNSSQNGLFAASSGTISSTGGITAIVAANTSTISGTATRSGIFGGNGNTIDGHDRSVILGGLNLSTSKDDEVVVPSLTGNGDVILGDTDNTISSTGAFNLIHGSTGTISGTANNSAIIASDDGANAISAGNGNSIISSRNSGISGGATLGSIIATRECTISGGSGVRHSAIIGSRFSSITGGSFYGQAILGARSANVAHSNSVVIGGNGLSTTKAEEVVVPSLSTNGQVKGAINVLTDAAGTTALDCSVGNYFTLAMPAGGSTTLTPSNITAGQTINIKITQNATAATLAYAASIEFPGGTPFTISTGSGEVDVLTLVSFDGTTLQATGLANFS